MMTADYVLPGVHHDWSATYLHNSPITWAWRKRSKCEGNPVIYPVLLQEGKVIFLHMPSAQLTI